LPFKVFPNYSSLIDSDFYDQSGQNIETYLTGTSLESSTLSWFSIDNEDLFKKNLKNYKSSDDNKTKLSLEFYLHNPIQYHTNKEVFRDTELSSKPDEVDVYLGCSHTFGVGLHLEDTWAYKLSSYLDFPFINASVPGSGPITHFRILALLSKRFKIRRVYYFIDHMHNRLEWYSSNLSDQSKNKYNNITPFGLDPSYYGIDKNKKQFLLENLFNENNRTLIQLFSKYGLQGFCSENNIELISGYLLEVSMFLNQEHSTKQIKPSFKFDETNDYYARDLQHPSIKFFK